jgi:hypothetical protein
MSGRKRREEKGKSDEPVAPFASSLAIAAERVHPVPCVFLTSRYRRSVFDDRPSIASHNKSTTTRFSPSPMGICPPLRYTHRTPCLPSSTAHRSMSSTVLIEPFSHPTRNSPSGMLGVTTVAQGRRTVRRVSTASAGRRECPLVDTQTGSTTSFAFSLPPSFALP